MKILPLWIHKDQGDASVQVLPLFTPHVDKRVTITPQYLNKDMIQDFSWRNGLNPDAQIKAFSELDGALYDVQKIYAAIMGFILKKI